MKYVIIGNGVAGIEAAVTINKNTENAEITVISNSKYLHYFRPALIDFISGESSIEKITVHKDEFYEKNNIKNVLNTEIISIEKVKKRILDSKGNIYEYDKLLIASGSIPFVPPIKGCNLNRVFTLRGIRDAQNIFNTAANVKNIIVIGGGLLGLETANSLNSDRKKITVIETAEWLLPRQLDRKGGDILKQMLLKKNIHVETGKAINEIKGTSGKVSEVILSDSTAIQTEMAVLSAGIRPQIQLSEKSGIKTGRGIIINNFMQTSDENIYAAGDAAEYNGLIYGLWITSKEQGRVAGLNMAGIVTEYKGSIISSSLKVTDIDLFSAGDISSEGTSSYSIVRDNLYIKITLTGDKPSGIIVIGDKKAIKTARSVMNLKIRPEKFIKEYSLQSH